MQHFLVCLDGQINTDKMAAPINCSPARPQHANIPDGMVATGAIADAVEVLETLSNQSLSILASAKITKLLNWSAPIITHFIGERNDIVNLHGTPTGNNQFNIVQEKVGPFNAMMNGLRSEPTAAPPREYLIDLASLADAKVTPVAYGKLQIFIKE